MSDNRVWTSKKVNQLIALVYNFLISLLVIVAELETHDKTGQGLIAIPVFLMLITPVHCLISFCVGLRHSFKTALFSALYIAGLNILFFFVDIVLIVLIFNFLEAFGLVY